MRTTDFNFKATAAQLNETMFKKFGTKLNFEKYTREDLENYRNLLRTKIHQAESSTNFNDLLTNETYQKDKYVMTVLNTKIKEMLGEAKKINPFKKNKAGPADEPEYPDDDADDKRWDDMDEGTKNLPGKQEKIDADKDGKIEKSDLAALRKNKKKAQEGVEEKTMNRLTTEAKSKLSKKDYDGDGKKETPKAEVWGSRAKAAAKSGKPFQETMKKKCCCSSKGEDKCPVHGKMEEGFPTVDDAKKRHEQEKGTGKFDKKELKTGTQYTRKSSTFSNGTEDKPKNKKVKEGSKPDFLDLDNDGNKKEPMKKATDDKKKPATAASNAYTQTSGYPAFKKKKIKESTLIFRRHVAIVNESLINLLNEDEEGKAKAITAASDMVNDFTTWMQRVGQYQTKSMIELADTIRAEFGQEESDAFKSAVGPALTATLEIMTQQREAISHAVAVLAGEASDMAQMGGDDLGGMEPGADEFGGEMPAGDEMNTDEFGASDAAAGGAETSGRELRESRFARKMSESHSIMRALSR